MPKAKYAIENSIAMQAGFRNLVQQVDFSEPDVQNTLKEFPCHIYMICSRPRITIEKKSIVIAPDNFKGTFQKHYVDNAIPVELSFPNIHGFHSFDLNNSGNRIKFKNENGEIVSDAKTSLIYLSCLGHYDPVLDFKVLYVGQAFGKDGERVAADRLISHSTLQKIYADAMSENPSEDIWLIMWQFKPYFISMIGGHTSDSVIGFDESYEKFSKLPVTKISLDQKITITEASLIRYFSPIYNTEYKTSFPSKHHSSYDFCYKLDFNNTCFELDTKSIGTRLYSEVVKPSVFHTGSYFLHNEKERKDMFRF